jgi:hypothetical protein
MKAALCTYQKPFNSERQIVTSALFMSEGLVQEMELAQER